MAFSAAAIRPVTRTGQLDGGQRGHHREHHGTAGHVALHVDHRLAGLDREATGVERDALADQHHPRAAPRAAGRTVVELGSAAAGSPTPGRHRGSRRTRRRSAPRRPRPSTSVRTRRRRTTAWSASHRGFFRFDGTVASIRARQPAPPTAIARSRSRAHRLRRRRSARTTRATGVCSGRLERQWKPNEPSISADHERLEPAVVGDRRDRGGDADRSRVARARAAPARRRSAGRCVADADECTSAAPRCRARRAGRGTT